jgi:hypothetical protein
VRQISFLKAHQVSHPQSRKLTGMAMKISCFVYMFTCGLLKKRSSLSVYEIIDPRYSKFEVLGIRDKASNDVEIDSFRICAIEYILSCVVKYSVLHLGSY